MQRAEQVLRECGGAKVTYAMSDEFAHATLRLVRGYADSQGGGPFLFGPEVVLHETWHGCGTPRMAGLSLLLMSLP